MNLNQVKELLTQYDNSIEREGHKQIEKNDYPTISHIRWMCHEVCNWTDTDIDKAMRWLGFIQCWLVLTGRYTIEQLKKDNKQ